jgi:hypothetical protein
VLKEMESGCVNDEDGGCVNDEVGGCVVKLKK